MCEIRTINEVGVQNSPQILFFTFLTLTFYLNNGRVYCRYRLPAVRGAKRVVSCSFRVVSKIKRVENPQPEPDPFNYTGQKLKPEPDPHNPNPT